MPLATFDIILEQPVIISQQSATAGAHQSLDFVPGSAVLGLAASRLYASLPAESAWTLFHSGRVRFGDGLPLSAAGEPAYPVPLCWHTYKGESARGAGDTLRADALFDPSRSEADPGRQPVQLRGGYATLSGQSVTPSMESTLKTAIDPDSGMAAESQLFGYQALSAGQRFRTTIRADEDIEPALWQTLLEHLAGAARLGRSRSAQFGAVRFEATGSTAQDIAAPSAASDANMLTLWLLSDLALERDGQPCLQPEAALLGLPEGSQWLVSESFLRTRRFSPYNAYRRGYDPERQLIARGSVLRYRVPRPLNEDERRWLDDGLGLFIEAGLGRVWINPPLLAGNRPGFSPATRTTLRPVGGQQTVAARPTSLLLDVLERRLARRSGGSLAEQAVRRLYEDLCERIREARRYKAVAPGVALGEAPGRSQWGRLKETASNLRRPDQQDELMRALTDADNGILRSRSGWEVRFGPTPVQQLDQWICAQLGQLAGNGSIDLAALVGHLAVLGLQAHWVRCVEGTEAQLDTHASREDVA